MGNFELFLDIVWNKYVKSDEGLATLFVILAIVLKLLINRRVTKLHFKKMLVSIPSEITFLVIGFLLSTMVRETYRAILAMIVIALIIIVIQYALEHFLDDKLSGKIGIWYSLCIIVMYAMSMGLYYIVVFGGNY